MTITVTYPPKKNNVPFYYQWMVETCGTVELIP